MYKECDVIIVTSGFNVHSIFGAVFCFKKCLRQPLHREFCAVYVLVWYIIRTTCWGVVTYSSVFQVHKCVLKSQSCVILCIHLVDAFWSHVKYIPTTWPSLVEHLHLQLCVPQSLYLKVQKAIGFWN